MNDKAGIPQVGAVKAQGYVYQRSPMLVYWETTLACGLSCRHCRATAQANRSRDELDTAESLHLLDQITEFGSPAPHIVFTGGDPLRREDLEVLVAGATERGIGCSLAPAVTTDLTPERLASLRDAGVQAVSLSLDGSTAALHDGLRQVPGTFEMTMQALDWLQELQIPVQINTLVTDTTIDDLPAIYDLLTTKAIMRWSVFFLISIGRGDQLQEVTPAQAERLFHWLWKLTRRAPFQIKTTEAMNYRRVAVHESHLAGMTDEEIAHSPLGRGFGIRDGNGIMFINYRGEIHPSGFLPVSAGNVRESHLVEIYRHHPLFVQLRDTSQLEGRCGICEYADICGGSRARAYAHTGNVMAADPLCLYHPEAQRIHEASTRDQSSMSQ